jgi:competence protein ComEA
MREDDTTREALPMSGPDGSESVPAGMPESARRRYAHALAAPLVLLVPIACWAVFSLTSLRPVAESNAIGSAARPIDPRINPNTAPWHELTALPRIGEVTAKRIVAFREEHRSGEDARPVFRCPEDLANVHGIGPKTVERLRPHLRFD